tara:strand:+ start:279 stop:500 length:222 start_codon:yes stop_codon:yes gene_type:complete
MDSMMREFFDEYGEAISAHHAEKNNLKPETDYKALYHELKAMVLGDNDCSHIRLINVAYDCRRALDKQEAEEG